MTGKIERHTGGHHTTLRLIGHLQPAYVASVEHDDADGESQNGGAEGGGRHGEGRYGVVVHAAPARFTKRRRFVPATPS